MNWDHIEQDWKRFKVQAKRNWDRLSQHELLQINGSRDQLCAKIQQAYGISKSEAELQIDEWASGENQRAPADHFDGGQTQRQSSL